MGYLRRIVVAALCILVPCPSLAHAADLSSNYHWQIPDPGQKPYYASFLALINQIDLTVSTLASTSVSTVRSVNTTSPLGGGGALSGDLTLTCDTCLIPGGALGTPSSGVGTNITGVNAATLGGATFAAPGAIGGGTPSTGAFSTVTASTFTGTFTGTALLATDTVAKSGTGSTYLTNTAPTLSSPTLTTKVNLPRVTALPGSPSAGDTVIVTDDSTVGACDSAAGTSQSFCQYNGAAWVSLGDGAASGSISGLTTNIITKASSSTTIANSLLTDNGTTLTYTGTGGIASGPAGVAGRLDLLEGTSSALVANTVSYYAPVDVAAGGIAFVAPAAAATGFPYYTNAAGVMTESIVTFYDEVWRDAAGCNNATAGPVWNNNTANPPAYVCEGTNTRLATADFDETTDEGFDGSFRLPTGFTGAIDVIFRWKAEATTGAAGWCYQLVRIPTGATSDPALPAQAAGNCVSSTVAGTTLQEVEATISGVTCTSCVAGDRIGWRVSRDANGGAVTDSMTGDGKLIGWMTRIRRAM